MSDQYARLVSRNQLLTFIEEEKKNAGVWGKVLVANPSTETELGLYKSNPSISDADLANLKALATSKIETAKRQLNKETKFTAMADTKGTEPMDVFFKEFAKTHGPTMDTDEKVANTVMGAWDVYQRNRAALPSLATLGSGIAANGPPNGHRPSCR